MTYTLITGACGGLGRAFAALLAARGEALVLTGRSGERLSALSSSLKKKYPACEIRTFVCDLSQEASRRALFEKTDGENISFHRLVYVAGIDTQMAFEKYDEGRIVRQARVNFEGAVSLTRAVLDRCPLDGKSEFLAVGSVSGISPMPYFALYSASKRALEQFYTALRTELKGRAKVTCVLPGSIPTREDIKENIAARGAFGKLSEMEPEKVAKKALSAVAHNKKRKVIGFWNRLINRCACLLPLSLRLRLIARLWKKTEKDYYRD